MRKNIFLIILIVSELVCSNSFCKEAGLYKISDEYDIRQFINPDGITYFVTPFDIRNFDASITESDNFVFLYYTNHLNVYFKKEHYWRVFTYSDGYVPVGYKERYADYKDRFVIYNLDDKNKMSKVVLVFDKNKSELFTLTREQYLGLKSNWNEIKYSNPDVKWEIGASSVVRWDTKTNQKEYYWYRRWDKDRITDMDADL